MKDFHNTAIIVPARLASLRFPEKLLAETMGKPLILHTALRLKEQIPEIDLFFAVDGDRLSDILTNAGFNAIKTDPSLPSGTDRIAQANDKLGFQKVINIQADEPMVLREHVLALAEALNVPENAMSTLAIPFGAGEDPKDPNHVKVVVDENGSALYFSRSPIPFSRDEIKKESPSKYLKHLGMYAYQASFLSIFSDKQPTPLEKIEKLEQLRALEMGMRIAVCQTQYPTLGVDHPDDLDRFAKLLSRKI